MLEKLQISKKLFKQLDFSSLIIMIIISVFGALNIYSAQSSYAKLQLTWLVVGLVIIYLILTIDYGFLGSYAHIIYWAGVVFLIINDFAGKVSNGARGWIAIGSRAIQPSEFAKLGMIILLAKKLNEMEGDINNFKNFMTLTIYAAIPMVLIVIQPDMGMTMVCFFIVLGMYFISGLNLKVILGGLITLVLAITLVWNSGLIQDYQKQRLISFTNPQADKLGKNYQLWQSLVGIGSGGITGKGYLKGTQVKGGFVPEAHTDFIFAVVGEQFGLIGGIFLLSLYGLLLYKFINIARHAKDILGTMLCIGIISSFLFSILQNIGMTIGRMPITGITLPFMSYGGSSMLTYSIAVGIVLNVGMRRKKINF